MKKIFIVLAAFAALIACNSGEPGTVKEEKKDTVAADPNALSSNPIYQKGLELEANSDCKTCHNIDTRLQGPSYQEIASKYAGMPDTIVSYLAGKIIKGGTGVWDIPIQMTPHPSMSQEDAETLVKFIFLYEKK
jgi:cytochrome c